MPYPSPSQSAAALSESVLRCLVRVSLGAAGRRRHGPAACRRTGQPTARCGGAWVQRAVARNGPIRPPGPTAGRVVATAATGRAALGSRETIRWAREGGGRSVEAARELCVRRLLERAQRRPGRGIRVGAEAPPRLSAALRRARARAVGGRAGEGRVQQARRRPQPKADLDAIQTAGADDGHDG